MWPAAAGVALLLTGAVAHPQGQSAGAFVPYSNVRPIVEALRSALLPPELRDATPADREMAWPAWIARRDAAIRARVADGDEDSIVHFLCFGTSFTARRPATDAEVAALSARDDARPAWLTARVNDLLAGIAAPGTNQRLQFARSLVDRKGMDLTTAAGRDQVRAYLDARALTMSRTGTARSSALLNPDAERVDTLTVFKDRGLSSDTSIFIDLGIHRALDAMSAAGELRPGSVRRVALIGPGLDFTDKLEGYDFYPEQTIQPFALIDSLLRLNLAVEGQVDLTAFDLSPRVLQHLDSARTQARAGRPYSLVLPRNADRAWTRELVDYWRTLGNRVGSATTPPSPPVSAGRVDARGLLVRPPVVLSIAPVDLNVVTQWPDVPAANRFDLIVATNILLYYDVFEQSLAAANIARLLRPGGFLLTNNQVFEVPATPLGGVGFTDSTYMSLPGVGNTGDRVIWYQRH